MSKALPTRALATTLLALVSVAAQAQAQNDHAAHGQADAQTARHPLRPWLLPPTRTRVTRRRRAARPRPRPWITATCRCRAGRRLLTPAIRMATQWPDIGIGRLRRTRCAAADAGRRTQVLSLRGETLERRFTRKGDDSTAYDLQAWYGTTYNKAVVKAEGDIAKGKLEESRTELLGHAVAPYWDTQLGVRVDNGKARAVNGWLSASRASPLLVRAGGDGLRGKWWTYGAACRRQLRAAADPATDSGASRRVAVLWQGRPGTRYRQGPGRSVCWLAPAL